jgi:hypothetical protein
MCVRIIMEEIKSFRPAIYDEKNIEVTDNPDLKWMTESPDRVNAWPVWLSRFLYNTLVYDANPVFTPRDRAGKINMVRVIDGSTIFVLVDENGELPLPPAPAYIQVIYGVNRAFFNKHQLWYSPRHLRTDAPYGRSPIEDCIPALLTLDNIWKYQQSWYTEGTIPEQVYTSPEKWTAQQILDFENEFNDRMRGNTEERAGRARWVPAGTSALATKDATFPQELYDMSVNTIRMTFGIPRTEFGESPGTGLGGSGFLEAMQSTFYRLGLAPVKAYIEGFWQDVLIKNGMPNLHYTLAFPNESLDPAKEEEKYTTRFEKGVITRDEARQGMNLKPLGGEEGAFIVTPQGGGPGQPGTEEGGQGEMAPGGKIPVNTNVPVRRMVNIKGMKIPIDHATEEPDMVDVAPKTLEVKKIAGGGAEAIPTVAPARRLAKLSGTDPEDDAYFGSPARIAGKSAYIGSSGQEERKATWLPGADAALEAVYLVDRRFAQDTEHYMVPLTYEISNQNTNGIVTATPPGRKGPEDVSGYAPEWLAQAAMLDYICGVKRAPGEYQTHRMDADRPVMTVPTEAFSDTPSSPFVRAWGEREFPDTLRQGAEGIVLDHVLWRDVAGCVGEERAEQARQRAEELHTNGQLSPASLVKAQWSESDHPRADDGKFGSGGGGGSQAEEKPQETKSHSYNAAKMTPNEVVEHAKSGNKLTDMGQFSKEQKAALQTAARHGDLIVAKEPSFTGKMQTVYYGAPAKEEEKPATTTSTPEAAASGENKSESGYNWQTHDPKTEFDSMMVRDPKNPQSSHPKTGVTREHVQMAMKRRDAIMKAERTKYKNGETVASYLGGILNKSPYANIEVRGGGTMAVTGLEDGKEMILKDTIAKDYVKTRLNRGEFKPGYDPEAMKHLPE